MLCVAGMAFSRIDACSPKAATTVSHASSAGQTPTIRRENRAAIANVTVIPYRLVSGQVSLTIQARGIAAAHRAPLWEERTKWTELASAAARPW